ncbi:hypothetical protein [Arthrobacter sp. UYEF3]|uniref:hypothetical protein n=1 Tax=Arthrobacter sp. UYEF3 TaxID=1756365 RepID=UPI0033996F43
MTADYVQAAEALAAPAVSAQERTGQEMAVVAEVACIPTVSERTAGALISDALALVTALPLTLTALQAGTMSWQHARIMVDETANLDGAGAGELVPGRFRARARTWRERHHPVSIETRHTRSAGDRRVEFAPDRDGMAWLSAYLGRAYSSEHQDWEPPRWPQRFLAAATGTVPGRPVDPGNEPEPEPPPDLGPPAGPGPEPELPEDPVPDWYLFTAAHPLPDADTDDPWGEPLDAPFPAGSRFLDA